MDRHDIQKAIESGRNAKAAVKALVMPEDNANTVWFAMQIGVPDVIPQGDVDTLHHHYTNVYGQ